MPTEYERFLDLVKKIKARMPDPMAGAPDQWSGRGMHFTGGPKGRVKPSDVANMLGMIGGDFEESGGAKAAATLAKKAVGPKDLFGGIRPDAEVRQLWAAAQEVEGLADRAAQAGFKLSKNDQDWITTAKEAAMSHMSNSQWASSPQFRGQGKAPHDAILKLQGILGTIQDSISRRLEAAGELEGRVQSSRGIEMPQEVGRARPQEAPKAVSQPAAPNMPAQVSQPPITAPQPSVQDMLEGNRPAPKVVESEPADLESKLKAIAGGLSAEQKSKLAKWAKMTTRPSMKEHSMAIDRVLELEKNPSSEIPGEKDLLRHILRDTDMEVK